MTAGKAAAARLSFFYAAFFALIGIHMPFWPVWLAAKGMSVPEIGTLLAVGVGIKVIGNPLVAHFADRSGERRRPMAWLAAGALGFFLLFHPVAGFWPLLGVTVLFSLCWSAMQPLGESLTLLAIHAENLDYGRIRLWGSLTFIAMALLSGRLLVDQPPGLVFWMVASAVLATFASCLLLPDHRAPRAPDRHRPLGVLLRDRRFLLFLASTLLVQDGHAVYYAFATLEWQRIGYSEDLIGLLWGEGVVAEIVLFAAGAGLVRRLGPERLLALASAAAVVRWTATALGGDALPVLIAVQVLHAFTFGAAHLAAIHHIARNVPPTLSASAQSLYSAVVMGAGMGLSIYLAGVLYDAFGSLAYLAMAAMGGAGLGIALLLGSQRP